MTWEEPPLPRFYVGQLVVINGPRRSIGEIEEFPFPYAYNDDRRYTVDLGSVGEVYDPTVDGDGEISVRWLHFPEDDDCGWFWPADRVEPADPIPDLTDLQAVDAWLKE